MNSFKTIYKDQNKFKVSFEVFPPKTEKGRENLLAELQLLKDYEPSYISVTYGAMGSTRVLTADLATHIQKDIGVPTAFHFTCVGTNKDEIKDYVSHLEEQGLNLVVSLRGDPPADKPFQAPKNGFAYANELVSYLNSVGNFSQAVAGYPEGHVESESLEMDLKYLKQKVDAGADIIITQLFFDNEFFYDFVKRVRDVGIDIPIIPGIMPIVNLSQVERITKMCGASIPKHLYEKLNTVRDNQDKVREIGLNHAIEQCQDLKRKHKTGIHFYMLNKSQNVTPILDLIM